MKRYISINPLDTLFFRDAKPFSMGSETWADGVFPPFPSTILGAIRSKYISNHPSGPTDEVIETALHQISLFHMSILLDGQNYFPLPFDLVGIKGEEAPVDVRDGYNAVRLVLKEMASEVGASSYACPMVLTTNSEERLESLEGGLLSRTSLKDYLENHIGEKVGSVQKIKDWIINEPKTGIGRSNETNTAAESQLYRVGMVRPLNFEFIIGVELPGDYSAGTSNGSYLIKFGAESKAARMELIIDELVIDEFNIEPEFDEMGYEVSPCYFKIYLSTPGVFKNGWYPDLSHYGIEADLLGAAVGKPNYVGGFDLRERRPKPLVRAVPAGSVYYYKSKNCSLKDVVEKIYGKSISEPVRVTETNGKESNVDLRNDGFGIAYVGKWEPGK